MPYMYMAGYMMYILPCFKGVMIYGKVNYFVASYTPMGTASLS